MNSRTSSVAMLWSNVGVQKFSHQSMAARDTMLRAWLKDFGGIAPRSFRFFLVLTMIESVAS